VARELGLRVVTLSAFSGENPLRRRGDLNLYVGAQTYGDAETCHSTVLHHWMNLVQLETPDA
jgi:D-sedoheptulose 7-phosphate isomerase